MPRKWTGKWFQRKSGVTPTRHGRGRGRSRGLRTQAAVPSPVAFQKAQPPAATQPERRRRRTRKPAGGQK